MIRRGFWVVTGAVLGVTGYRRVTRLASMVTAPKSARSRPAPGSAAGPRMLPPTPGRVLVQATPRRLAPGRQARGGIAPGGLAPGRGVRTNVARAVAAAGFLRDVRDGMAEYWDLHRGQPEPVRTGRTLEAQARDTHTVEAQTLEANGDRTSSGVRQQGRREP
jgi:hypothetical protein